VVKSSRELAKNGILIGILGIVITIILSAIGPLYADLVGDHTTDNKIVDMENKINKMVQDSSGPLDIDENTKEELRKLSTTSSHYGTGLSEALLGYPNVAESEFSIAIDQQTPFLSKCYLQRGNVRYLSGNYSDALEDYSNATDLEPENAIALVNKGIALGALDRNEEALNTFNKAIEIDPKYAIAWNNKGVALINLDRDVDALDALDKAIEIDPKYAIAWNNKGVALGNCSLHWYWRADNRNEALNAFNRGLNEALNAFNKAIENDPKIAGAWYNKAVVLINLRRYNEYEEVLTAFNRTIKNDPNLRRYNEYEEVLTAFNRTIKNDPKIAGAWYNKAVFLSYYNSRPIINFKCL
jgi:tetratricopeptide (TPR) repeat protein